MTLTDFLLARITEDELFWDLVEGSKQAHPDRIRQYRAECEAKRRIVKTGERGDGDWAPGTRMVGYRSAGREVLCALAAVYADHPDYRDEWKP